MLLDAGYSSVKCVIRKIRENKKLIKTSTLEGCKEELVDEDYTDDIDPNKEDISSEWLCVIAEK